MAAISLFSDSTADCRINTELLQWDLQDLAMRYDVVRSSTPDFTACNLVSVTSAYWNDTEAPLAGNAFYYLVRAAEPNVGTWGKNSTGGDRTPGCHY